MFKMSHFRRYLGVMLDIAIFWMPFSLMSLHMAVMFSSATSALIPSARSFPPACTMAVVGAEYLSSTLVWSLIFSVVAPGKEHTFTRLLHFFFNSFPFTCLTILLPSTMASIGFRLVCLSVGGGKSVCSVSALVGWFRLLVCWFFCLGSCLFVCLFTVVFVFFVLLVRCWSVIVIISLCTEFIVGSLFLITWHSCC